MEFYNELGLVYSELSKLNFSLFCKEKCHQSEKESLKSVVNILIDKDFCKIKENECDKEDCIGLIDVLLKTIHKIEKYTCCDKNYGYLLQLERFSCILKNLKNLICQLRCLPNNGDCELISKTFCVLIEILSSIIDIISKINNIECLCSSCMCCKCEMIECLLCNLVENISSLEELVAKLSHLVLQIVSLNVINCTSCSTSCCSVPKKRDYLEEYFESYYLDQKCYDIKPRKYYR
ncbi:hypothetical protein [Romboutsia lituseburensis]|uniref:hypothetical protein n=1 Tax=Romboutsia lituseburensis TaxID=1537 RepID=UPI00215A3CA9|nr:hypothetical protein [Romboutsia lituseburensis]MCR8744605.1 hypothetical protein [Romboutsia lituseburensis]